MLSIAVDSSIIRLFDYLESDSYCQHYDKRGPPGSRFYMRTETRASTQTRWSGSFAALHQVKNARLTQLCICVHHDISCIEAGKCNIYVK